MPKKKSTNIVQPVLKKPQIGGSVNEWGHILNNNIDKLTQFSSQVIADSQAQNQELSRLEKEKLNISDVPSVVEPVVDEYIETTVKPNIEEHINDYIENTSKPDINSHVEQKKQELNTYVDTVNKVELDKYEKIKESELDTHTANKKTELDSYNSEKKTELDEHTDVKKGELDTYTNEKKTELDSHTNVKKEEITSHTNVKKSELDTYEKEKESQLDTYTTTKETQLDEYTNEKKVELNSHTETKKTELDTYVNEEKKAELDSHTEIKKQEITTHTDEEIKRIDGNTLLGTKLDKGGYDGTAQDLKNLIDNKPNTEVVAGKGLSSSQEGNVVTLNIESADEGILVDDKLQLNIVNDLITGGVKRPLSAEQGKVLKQLIDAIGSGGALNLLRKSRAIGESDYLGVLVPNGLDIVVGNKLFKPTLYLDGTRIDKDMYTVDLNSGAFRLNQAYATYQVTWVVEDEMQYHIRFSYPTLALLQSDNAMKSIINLGDVIEILGESEANDGGHRWVICENTSKLNGVDIGEGRFLNEIPNSRPSEKVNKVENGLLTSNRNIVEAINEGLWRVFPKSIGSSSVSTNILEWAMKSNDFGFFRSGSGSNLFTGLPQGSATAFELFLNGISVNGLYRSMFMKDYGSNRMWINSQTSWQEGNLNWVGWSPILTTDEKHFLGNAGIPKIIYIQDKGDKTRGNGYVDRDTGKLYLCYPTDPKVNTVPDTTVTSNFVLATSVENAFGVKKQNPYKWFVGTHTSIFQNKSYAEIKTGLAYVSSYFFTTEINVYSYAEGVADTIEVGGYMFSGKPRALGATSQILKPRMIITNVNGEAVIRFEISNPYYYCVHVSIILHNGATVPLYGGVKIIEGSMPVGGTEILYKN